MRLQDTVCVSADEPSLLWVQCSGAEWLGPHFEKLPDGFPRAKPSAHSELHVPPPALAGSVLVPPLSQQMCGGGHWGSSQRPRTAGMSSWACPTELPPVRPLMSCLLLAESLRVLVDSESRGLIRSVVRRGLPGPWLVQCALCS